MACFGISGFRHRFFKALNSILRHLAGNAAAVGIADVNRGGKTARGAGGRLGAEIGKADSAGFAGMEIDHAIAVVIYGIAAKFGHTGIDQGIGVIAFAAGLTFGRSAVIADDVPIFVVIDTVGSVCLSCAQQYQTAGQNRQP